MSGFTEVFAWGGDHFGQLGQGTPSPGKTYTLPRLCSFNIVIRELACGDEHTAFADSHGNVYTMGSNSEGRLGVGDRSIKQSASPCLVEGVNRVVTLDCGWGHTAAVTEEGAVYTWGMGEHGELGLGSTESHWQPVRVSMDARVRLASCGARHTAVIGTDSQGSRSLYVFGSGEAGQLGTGRRERELLPVRLSTSEEVKQVSCGIFQTGFITVQGKLYMTGGNSFGQLGLGTRKSSNTPQRVPFFSGMAVAKVACGHHTAAVTEAGELFIWGSGVFGEFISPQKQSISATIRDISVGGGFGAALDSSRKVWVWGSNENGELGQGDYEARASPVLLAHLSSRRVRLVSCGGCAAIALGADVSEGMRSGRNQSPNTARTSSRSPYRPSSSKSPLKAADRPLTTERGYRSPLPYQRPLDMSRVEDESFERSRLDLQRSEDHRRTEINTSRQETFAPHIRELEDLLKRKEAELVEVKSRLSRVQVDAEGTAKSLDGQIQVLLRQNQSLSSESQRLRQDLEARSTDFAHLKHSQAVLQEANSKLARDYSSAQQVLEDLQRRTDTESKFKDSYQAQSSRLREDYERQLQALQTRLEEEVVQRRQVSQDLELATAHRRRLEDSLNGYVGKIDSLNEEKRRLEGEGGLVEQLKEAVVGLERDLDAERQGNGELKRRLEALQANGKSQSLLEGAVNELKYQVETLHRQNNDQIGEIDSLRLDLREKSEDFLRLQSENADLREAVTTAELKNRELFTNFERELTSRARNYREKTLNMLNSPQSTSPKPTSSLRTDRYRGSPGLNLSVVSEKAHAGAMSTRRGLLEPAHSPEASARAGERYSPPTFREGGAGLKMGVKSSITEIREKLASLQQNKSLLEAKMRDFERKIKPGAEDTE